jgi:hypothetical protein
MEDFPGRSDLYDALWQLCSVLNHFSGIAGLCFWPFPG